MELTDKLNSILNALQDAGVNKLVLYLAIVEYGNNCYNQALEDAASNAEVSTVWYDEGKSAEVNKQSILTLKKH